MPKVRRLKSLSLERSKTSPYAFSSENANQYQIPNPLESAEDVKEWEEARCPICMEHPHNAVLLKCSSHEMGCRTYICNTSYRHSNCLDQFRKSFAQMTSATQVQVIHQIASTTQLQETPLSRIASHAQGSELSPPDLSMACESQSQPKLFCPLCRGEIYGYIVVEPARMYLNTKVRSCSSETCDFSGTYSELRKHARSEHPFVRPSDVDPTRHEEWMKLEREREFENVLSLIQSDYVEDSDLDPFSSSNISASSFVSDVYGSMVDLILTRFLDASRDSQYNDIRIDRWLRGPNGIESNRVTGRRNNSTAETMHHAQHSQHRNQRSSRNMPRSQHLRWRSQTPLERYQSLTGTDSVPQARARLQNGSESENISRASWWTSRTPLEQNQSSLDTMPRASRLRWRNQRWSLSYNDR